MPTDKDELIEYLKKTNEQQALVINTLQSTIANLQGNISELQGTIANLNETIEELRRKLFGTSSEKVKKKEDSEEMVSTGEEKVLKVKEHTRTRKPKSVRKDLYESLPVREVKYDVPENERICPDCDAPMKHLGYTFVREELRIIPAKVERIRIMREKLKCPVCHEEDVTTIVEAKVPTALLAHSPASASMVSAVMYEKSFKYMPYYRQEADWKQKGVPLPRETAANWYNTCALKYLLPIYDELHKTLIGRDIIHADETVCQVLHEKGKEATSVSYMWIYTSGTDGLAPIALYDYRSGRSGDYPIEFLQGFHGMLQCDGYAAYGRIEDVILVCCLAHCRRKFYEAVPAARRKKLKLLDISSEQELKEPDESFIDDTEIIPAEKGVLFCNQLFFQERLIKELSAEDRKEKRLEKETVIWENFWNWINTLNPSKGSKLEKAVNYAINHQETLMNYLKDGRCEISNNAAERKAKAYATGRKNFLFHDTEDGAKASAVVMSLIETAKMNNLNVFQYLYVLLLYMPDYKDEPAGIEQLLPWSEFIKEKCSGVMDTENLTPENRGSLQI
ncbi:MAG: IS66 family transposase [Lachnospiraceae bacterium]|nr:IS66 family transposase [Lachnospiraceae bacterium]